jgi:Transcriptional activator of glycolytic enzymes
MGLAERQDKRGRTTVFRFANAMDDPRPPRLADNLKSVGQFWQEWEHGIAGNLPAKLWTEAHTSNRKNEHAFKFSRRKPIYLLLDRLINIKKKLPAEAFRLIEDHFSGLSMTQLGKRIRSQEQDGTLHPDLADRHHPLQLQPPTKRRKKKITHGVI